MRRTMVPTMFGMVKPIMTKNVWPVRRMRYLAPLALAIVRGVFEFIRPFAHPIPKKQIICRTPTGMFNSWAVKVYSIIEIS